MTLRIGGLGGSGLDTESVIQTLLEAEMTPITRLEDEVAEDEEKYEAWDDLSEDLDELYDIVEDLKDYSLWNQRMATSSDDDITTATAADTARKGTYYIEVTSLALSHRVGSDSLTDMYDAGTTTAETVDDELGFSGTFEINGESVTVDTTDSMNDIVDKINEVSENMDDADKVEAMIIGTTLVIERACGEGSMTFSETGSENSVLRYLGILEGTPGDSGTYTTIDPDHELQVGQDLYATVNGVEVTGSGNEEITDIIEGVTLEFHETGTATLTIENDSVSVESLIDDFIDTYNDTLEYVRELGSAEVDSSSGELSSLGILQGDTAIRKIESELRSIVGSLITDSSVADEEYNSLYTIGIWFEDEEGYLEIYDEEKLENALEYHLEEVEDLFRAYGSDSSSGGIMRELSDYIYSLIDPAEGIVTTQMNDLYSDIDDNEDKIDELYVDLEKYEALLWEHYGWMEETVNDINSQMAYLTSSLGIS